MKIGIDARLFGLEHTGIGRYTMELVLNLLKIDHQNRYTVFIPPAHLDDLPSQANLTLVPVELKHYTLAEQLHFPSLIHRHHLDLLHVPHFNVPILIKTPFIVTIHDLLWHEVLGYTVTTLSPLMYTLKYLAYRLVVRHAVTRAQAIITPSKWVKNQVLSRFKINAQKINVIHEGVDHSFRPPAQSATKAPKHDMSLKRSFSIKTPFIIYTGSLYPHKNIVTLIKALKIINQKTSPPASLVIVSARSIFTTSLERTAYNLDLENYVQFVGFLSDDELNRLYQSAITLVHPSTSEGFGLTGLEAMAAGLPVISSTSASLPEIYGEAALYFNPNSPQDLANKVLSLLSQPQLRQTLIESGQEQASKYSWKKMTQETLNLYETCLRLRPNQ